MPILFAKFKFFGIFWIFSFFIFELFTLLLNGGITNLELFPGVLYLVLTQPTCLLFFKLISTSTKFFV